MLPILVGSFVIFKSDKILVFWGFLLYGFFTDFFVQDFLTSTRHPALLNVTLSIHNVYSLVDATFLFFFLGQVTPISRLKKTFQWVSLLMIPAWFVSHFIIKDAWSKEKSMSAIFDSGYEMALAVAAAIVLLQMTNPQRKTPNSYLWITIGIFFYNFCSFFIHAFIDSSIIADIWFLTSSINIITMVLYSIGFYFGLIWISLSPNKSSTALT